MIGGRRGAADESKGERYITITGVWEAIPNFGRCLNYVKLFQPEIEILAHKESHVAVVSE